MIKLKPCRRCGVEPTNIFIISRDKNRLLLRFGCPVCGSCADKTLDMPEDGKGVCFGQIEDTNDAAARLWNQWMEAEI